MITFWSNLTIFRRHFSADDINAKYQRIVGANLLGYSQYLEKLPRDQLLEAKEENKELILNTNKFWKYAKDESKAVNSFSSFRLEQGFLWLFIPCIVSVLD
jgi:hypothetical protein